MNQCKSAALQQMASEPRPEAEQLSPPSSSGGEFHTLEIEAPPAEQSALQQNGLQHTAIDVRPHSNGHQEQQSYTRKELKAEEKAGLLKGQPLSTSSAGGCMLPGPLLVCIAVPEGMCMVRMRFERPICGG